MLAHGHGHGTPFLRSGHVIAVLVNAGMLLAVNWWPGWQAVPVLTQEMRSVLGFVNLAILVNLAAGLVSLVDDRAWLKAMGDLVTLVVGATALVRMWQVFPFAFGSSSFDWTLVARSVLLLGILGSVIGIIAAWTSFVIAVIGSASDQAV